MLLRTIRHLAAPNWWLFKHLPKCALDHVEAAVAEAERGLGGELRVAVEASLGLGDLLAGKSARQRALEVFSLLRVWDTEDNNGVLLYVLLADRDVEIVADRGVARQISDEQWEPVCREMEALFQVGRQEEALLAGTTAIGDRLRALAHPSEKQGNQLPNRPTLLK